MKNVRWYWMLLGLVAAIAAVPGCAKNNGGGTTPPTTSPTGSSTASPTPGPCGTLNPTTSGNLVVVDVSTQIAPTTDPSYGPINGYTVEGSPNGDSIAQAIRVWYPAGSAASPAPITANNILQFSNADSNDVYHSATAFSTNKFPSVPYTFPTTAASPSANTTIGNGFWSTGQITPAGLTTDGSACYSQTFTLKPGVYYFGDLDYYNQSLIRDVLVVGTPAPMFMHRHPHVTPRGR